LDGGDYLSDSQEWAGRHIPIVPVVGEEIAFDGQVIRHGLIRWAKDPQRLYNYWRSAAAEMIALAPKAPFITPMKSIKGLEKFWNQANTANLPYLPYNPIEGEPQHVPKRAPQAEPPAAMWQEANVAQDDMKATTGVYDAALGAKSNETSGVAIRERQQESDTGTVVYFDNFNHAIQRTGEILVDLIPKVYDGDRVVRILGEDGAEQFVPINRRVLSTEGPVLINDLSAAHYDVRIKTGPSYANAKEVAKEELGKLIQSSPELLGVIGDLYMDSLDLPASIGGKITERIRKTIPPQMLGEDAPDDMPEPEPPPPDPKAELDLQLADARVANERAKADGQVLKNEELAERLGVG